MSLSAFKEALKACNNHSFSSNSSQTSLISTQFDSSAANPRKPPKSSVSRQLLLLEDPFTSSSQIPQKQTHSSIGVKDEKEEKEDEEAVEEERPIVFGRSKLESFLLDHTGPYEPLVLSPPGETPVVQVTLPCNSKRIDLVDFSF